MNLQTIIVDSLCITKNKIVQTYRLPVDVDIYAYVACANVKKWVALDKLARCKCEKKLGLLVYIDSREFANKPEAVICRNIFGSFNQPYQPFCHAWSSLLPLDNPFLGRDITQIVNEYLVGSKELPRVEQGFFQSLAEYLIEPRLKDDGYCNMPSN